MIFSQDLPEDLLIFFSLAVKSRLWETDMHSWSFKGLTDFSTATVTTRRRLPLRVKHDFTEFEVGTTRSQCQWWSKRGNFVRTSRNVACAASERDGNGGGAGGGGQSQRRSSSSSSFLSRSQAYALLKQQMEVAAKSEDYEEAARLRDILRSFEKEEPLLHFRRLLKEAISEERFEDAAKYRDELKHISPHALLKCDSDATTLGIRVQVRSVYVEGRSQPSKGLYFFAYRIRITNNSDQAVQLLRRHWIITDANGKTENVWGIGVIGEQPVILPKTSFEYSSACPLSTPNGRMEGDFEMKHVDRVSLQSFNAVIAPFSLSILGDGANTL